MEDINLEIWESLCKRLSKSKTSTVDERHNEAAFFEYKTGNGLDGIFNYLTNQAKGNIHDKGIVEITTNSNSDEYLYGPKNLVDFDSDSYYDSKENPGPKIVCFDFKDHLIKVTHYSIKTINNTSYYLRNWVIETSDDGKDWTEIDRRTNCKDLNNPLVTKTFRVKKCNFVRYVRFKHEGPDWNGHNDISISAMEFFGYLISPDSK